MLKEDVQMAIDERTQAEQQHALILKGRGKLSVSGVVDVQNFDESLVSMETSLGLLLVRGSGLHIERLSLEGGELELEGEIVYTHFRVRGKGCIFRLQTRRLYSCGRSCLVRRLAHIMIFYV